LGKGTPGAARPLLHPAQDLGAGEDKNGAARRPSFVAREGSALVNTIAVEQNVVTSDYSGSVVAHMKENDYVLGV
jgi:hypothetical protein